MTLFPETRRWVAFESDCEIPTTTHQRKQVITIRPRGQAPITSIGNTPELDEAIKQWQRILAPHAPASPLVGPLKLSASFMWTWRKIEPGANRLPDGIWRDTKPDLSNLVKTMEDVMEELGYYDNDSRIVSYGAITKRWGPTGHLRVVLEELGG